MFNTCIINVYFKLTGKKIYSEKNEKRVSALLRAFSGPLLNGRGLMTERSWIQIHTEEIIFQDQKPGAKRDNGMFQPTWHCFTCGNPANWRVDLEDGWLTKIHFHN